MELVWFNWKTNPDYADLLFREEIRTDNQIKKSELKRVKARLKRVAKAWTIKFLKRKNNIS